MAKLKPTVSKTTYLEPRKMRRATTALDNGGFHVIEKSPSYTKKKTYMIGYIYRDVLADGVRTSQQVCSKELYEAFLKEAKKNWKEHKEIITPGEQMTEEKEYYL